MLQFFICSRKGLFVRCCSVMMNHVRWPGYITFVIRTFVTSTIFHFSQNPWRLPRSWAGPRGSGPGGKRRCDKWTGHNIGTANLSHVWRTLFVTRWSISLFLEFVIWCMATSQTSSSRIGCLMVRWRGTKIAASWLTFPSHSAAAAAFYWSPRPRPSFHDQICVTLGIEVNPSNLQSCHLTSNPLSLDLWRFFYSLWST